MGPGDLDRIRLTAKPNSHLLFGVLKKAHLLRCRASSSLRRTLSTPALRVKLSALYLNLFERSNLNRKYAVFSFWV